MFVHFDRRHTVLTSVFLIISKDRFFTISTTSKCNLIVFLFIKINSELNLNSINFSKIALEKSMVEI